MKTLARYLAFQVPAWVIAGAVALGLDTWTSLSRGWIGVALLLYVLKDFALFPFVRTAYEAAPHEPGGGLVGASGRVVVPLDPEGWIEVRHERWRALSEDASSTIEIGVRVQIRELRGLVLVVDREA